MHLKATAGLLGILLVGCQAGPVVPTTLGLDQSADVTAPAASHEPAVRDTTGLVADARADAADPQVARRVTDVTVINPGGDLMQLHVVWVSTPCEFTSLVVVSRSQTDLLIDVYRGPSTPPNCEAMGVFRAMTLSMRTAVLAEDVRARLHEGLPAE